MSVKKKNKKNKKKIKKKKKMSVPKRWLLGGWLCYFTG